jgi:hypothetical protein
MPHVLDDTDDDDFAAIFGVAAEEEEKKLVEQTERIKVNKRQAERQVRPRKQKKQKCDEDDESSSWNSSQEEVLYEFGFDECADDSDDCDVDSDTASVGTAQKDQEITPEKVFEVEKFDGYTFSHWDQLEKAISEYAARTFQSYK